VRDIDTAVVDSLKVLDPNRPIREAEVCLLFDPATHWASASPKPVLMRVWGGQKCWSSWRRIKRVVEASVISPAIPTAALSPFAPRLIVVIWTKWIPRFYRRTICADGGVLRQDYMPVPSHCRPCCQGKYHGRTENAEFHNTLLHRRRFVCSRLRAEKYPNHESKSSLAKRQWCPVRTDQFGLSIQSVASGYERRWQSLSARNSRRNIRTHTVQDLRMESHRGC
jgi:hypothetical protein